MSEAMQLLRLNPKHKLWFKKIASWTAEDVSNLRNNPLRTQDTPEPNKVNPPKQSILVVDPAGKSKEYESATSAARELKIPVNNIYALINGRTARSFNYKFSKI
jgi:hypothetical protein